MTGPITSLFAVFSIYFVVTFLETKMGYINLHICVENLTRWPIVVPTVYATAQIVRNFISTEIIHPFRIPQIVVSDDAQCFTAVMMKEITAQQ